MRLVTFAPTREAIARVGVSVIAAGEEWIVDVARALELGSSDHDARSGAASGPLDMTRLIERGAEGLQDVRQAVGYASGELADKVRREKCLAAKLAYRADDISWLPPVPRPGKIIMIGGNYGAHVGERQKANDQLPKALTSEPADFPPAFAKFSSTLVGHKNAIVYPRNSHQLDYETELCVVIGKKCKDVRPHEFSDVVYGYTICNDVSMRDLQFPEMRRGSTLLGKNLDTAMPLGPYLVTADEVPDPQNLRLRCWVNGEERQNDTTKHMTHGVGQIIAHYSRLTLEPGDIIATGTPAGVGVFWNPPEHGLLRVGDVIEMEIEGLGRLCNEVVAEDESVMSDPKRGKRSATNAIT